MSISLFARLNHRFGPKPDLAARRRFLKVSAAATAGLLLSGESYAHARQALRGRRVVVIGAGFAGLACAHELKAVGYDVTVIEARDRVGGRVLSFNPASKSEFVPGKNVEGGGELIGSNHPCWVHYAERFGLEMLDLTVSEFEAPIIVDGKRLSEQESNALWDEMDRVFNLVNDDARPVVWERAWESANAAALDAKSVKAWLDGVPDLSPVAKRACDIQLSSDNGVEIANQSYLGMLAAVAGGGVERYWTESEVYRCKGGNQQLAHKLADAFGRDKIIFSLPVNAIEQRGDKVIVTCRDSRTIEADDVVVTVPPTVWAKIEFRPGLPPQLKPQMGVALKHLLHLKGRFWEADKLAPDSLQDQFVSQTWEGTDNQAGDEHVSLNCFSGGDAAEASLRLAAKDRNLAYAKVLGRIYPKIAEQFVAARYMSWPREQWTAGGYSCPGVGQVTTVGPALHKGVGRVHFAGEHCSYPWVGYMEGALHSGTYLARRIAARDGLKAAEFPMPPAPRHEEIGEPATGPTLSPEAAPKSPTNEPTTEPALVPVP